MPSLKVTGGPAAPSGKTLAAGTKLTIRFLDTYVDGVTRWPREHLAEYDAAYGRWKPLGKPNGTEFFVPGGETGSSNPEPPFAALTEQQVYSDGETQKFVDTVQIYETTTGEWFYATPAPGTVFVTDPDVPPPTALTPGDIGVPGGVASFSASQSKLDVGDIDVAGGVASVASVDLVEGDIATLQADMTTAEGDINTLQNDLTTAGGNISTAQGDINTLQNDMTTAQSDINSLQAGQSSGLIAYADLTELQNDTTQPDDTLGYVTNDPTASNNGYYSWDAATSTWTKASNDLISQLSQDVGAAEADVAALKGGASISDDRLEELVLGDSYRLTAAPTRDSDGFISSASIEFTDGSVGAYTASNKDATHGVYTIHTFSHTASGKTATVTLTLDSDGLTSTVSVAIT